MQFILEEESGTYILTGVLCFIINVASKRDNNQQAGMPPLRAGKTVCKRSGRGRKSSMTFSAASFRGLRKCGSCRWISMKSCSTGLWITQRFIRTAGWYSPSEMVWKSARRFKDGNGRDIGFLPDASGRFFSVWKSTKN